MGLQEQIPLIKLRNNNKQISNKIILEILHQQLLSQMWTKDSPRYNRTMISNNSQRNRSDRYLLTLTALFFKMLLSYPAQNKLLAEVDWHLSILEAYKIPRLSKTWYNKVSMLMDIMIQISNSFTIKLWCSNICTNLSSIPHLPIFPSFSQLRCKNILNHSIKLQIMRLEC